MSVQRNIQHSVSTRLVCFLQLLLVVRKEGALLGLESASDMIYVEDLIINPIIIKATVAVGEKAKNTKVFSLFFLLRLTFFSFFFQVQSIKKQTLSLAASPAVALLVTRLSSNFLFLE